ncbi:MAG: WXG100 family type VII secretion target [Leptolyngbya sp. PLA3]|nr:MAG: WXG100 family type VII secretion target [Cyanobacteria bacterium CYA]MCE7969005.1 WXG100 family type VII secretion target [Leptolyngbya sp. PL-A3]
MAKAVVDPEELRRFAQALKRFNANLSQQMNALNGQMQSLSQTWRDQEQAKFVSEFEHTMRTLTRFTQAAEQHIPFLLRKADRVEEYLRQR